MRVADVPAVVEIERQSFSVTWPARAYRREIEENRLAHYLVVREQASSATPLASAKPRHPFREIVSGVRSLVGLDQPQSRSGESTIVGYIGLWIMVDEAHITTIAVHPHWRRRGIGELLLIAAAELAHDLHARVLTLEVRASNTEAQALYRKFGFAVVGVRRRYYNDNNEDALIMTTDAIDGPAFQERLARIRAENVRKLGPVERLLFPLDEQRPGRDGEHARPPS